MRVSWKMTGGAAAVSLAILVPALSAWEVDLHYSLTSWLAEEAGFSKTDAGAIAAGDQGLDDSFHHAAIPNVIELVLTGNQQIAEALQEHHFPSGARVPAPPRSRVVGPGDLFARAEIEGEIRPGQSQPSLTKIGQGLHALQDSWSHQGVPDVPYNLRADWVCAHPAARGGWRSHDADLTYLHPQDALETAQATYEILQRFLKNYPRFRVHPAASWTQIEPSVKEFARAETDHQKDAWAVKANAMSSQLASGMTLPGRRGSAPAHVIRPISKPSDLPPPELLKDASSFTESWLGGQNVDAAASFVDLPAVTRTFSKEDLAALGGEEKEAVNRWCHRFLTMFLIEDHARVNRLGHGDPQRPGYGELPEHPVPDGPFRTAKTVGSIRPAGDDFIPLKRASGVDFAIGFQLQGLPHDALCLIWTQINGRWKIRRLFAIVV